MLHPVVYTDTYMGYILTGLTTYAPSAIRMQKSMYTALRSSTHVYYVVHVVEVDTF